MIRLLFITGTALVLSACGNGNDNNASPPPPDLDAAIEQIARAQCAQILGCCSETELDDVFAGTDATDQQTCEQTIAAQAQAFFQPSLQRSLDEDHISFAADRVTQCADAVEAQSCGEFRPTLTANVLDVAGCAAVVSPKLTLSGFCFEDFECDTGFCSVPPGEAEGACKNPPGVGEQCLNDRCGSDLRCGMDGICAEKLGEGELCARNADCESDVCAPDDEGEFVCKVVPPICTGP